MAKLTKATSVNTTRKVFNSGDLRIVILLLAVIGIAFLVGISFLIIEINKFDAAPYPKLGKPLNVPVRRNANNLASVEEVGLGKLIGCEDIAYEPESGFVYTGCQDGWIKRFTINDSVADTVVEYWAYTGGRPLGLAITDSGDVLIADAIKGLLRASMDGNLELLTLVNFADGVAIAQNGMVYFTDASTKYGFADGMLDLLEGRPYGRLLSYDPSTNQTEVLAQNLYFANGVEVSPDQDFVIVCESFTKRCSRYYVQGERKGSNDIFIENLPGLPDNLHYDGDGHYFLGIGWGNALLNKVIIPYPFVRNILAFLYKYLNYSPPILEAAGVIVLDLEGTPLGGYYDETWTTTTAGVRIGEELYMGSINLPYIRRLNLTQDPFNIGTS